MKSHGSGRVRRFSNLTGRVGSRGFQNLADRVGTRPVRFDLTREKPRIISASTIVQSFHDGAVWDQILRGLEFPFEGGTDNFRISAVEPLGKPGELICLILCISCAGSLLLHFGFARRKRKSRGREHLWCRMTLLCTTAAVATGPGIPHARVYADEIIPDHAQDSGKSRFNAEQKNMGNLKTHPHASDYPVRLRRCAKQGSKISKMEEAKPTHPRLPSSWGLENAKRILGLPRRIHASTAMGRGGGGVK